MSKERRLKFREFKSQEALVKIVKKLKEQYHDNETIAITVGFFDGVHLGHQKIFKRLSDVAKDAGHKMALTFSNHPQTLLNPRKVPSLINPLPQRIDLLKKQGLDTLFLLPFDEGIQNITADEFVAQLKEQTSFTDLVLGFGAKLGKDKEGDEELLRLLSKKYNYKLHIVEPYKIGKTTISSSLVRQTIQSGDLTLTETYLNRPYSILSTVSEGRQLGEQMGFPTINLDVEELALPPLGVYKVFVHYKQKKILGAANLGFAPTLQDRKSPILEVHMLEDYRVPYDDEVEVVFDSYIREEKKFHSIDELKSQINEDIALIKNS